MDEKEAAADWHEFCQGVTWRELVDQYEDALGLMRRYIDTHERTPHDLAVTFRRLSLLFDDVQRVARTSALLDQRAPIEAVEVILRVVGQVRREVPIVEQFGNA